MFFTVRMDNNESPFCKRSLFPEIVFTAADFPLLQNDPDKYQEEKYNKLQTCKREILLLKESLEPLAVSH